MSNEKINVKVTNWQKKAIPVLLAIVIFMQMLDATILNTALPTIANDFGISPFSMQSVILSYTLALALFTPLSAFLADRMGTRALFLSAIILFTLGSFISSMSQDLNILVLGRIIAGIGGAFLTPVMRLTLVKVYPKNELMPVLNYAVMPALIGPMIGPALGGYIVEVASWQWIFLMNIPIGSLTFIIGFVFMPDIKDRVTRFDIFGFLRFSSSLFLLIYGLDQITKGDALLKSILSLLMGSFLMISYWRYAMTVDTALFPTKLWLIRTYRIGFFGNLMARIGMSAIPFLLPLYLQLIKGYSPAKSGAMLIPFAIAGILTKPLIAPLLGYIGYRATLLINTGLMGIVLLSIAIFNDYLTTPLLIGLFFITGILNSLQFSAMNSLALVKLRFSLISSGSTLMFVNQQFSLSLGIAITLTLLNYTSKICPNMTLSAQFKGVFIVIGLVTLVTMIIFSRLQKRDGHELL